MGSEASSSNLHRATKQKIKKPNLVFILKAKNHTVHQGKHSLKLTRLRTFNESPKQECCWSRRTCQDSPLSLFAYIVSDLCCLCSHYCFYWYTGKSAISIRCGLYRFVCAPLVRVKSWFDSCLCAGQFGRLPGQWWMATVKVANRNCWQVGIANGIRWIEIFQRIEWPLHSKGVRNAEKITPQFVYMQATELACFCTINWHVNCTERLLMTAHGSLSFSLPIGSLNSLLAQEFHVHNSIFVNRILLFGLLIPVTSMTTQQAHWSISKAYQLASYKYRWSTPRSLKSLDFWVDFMNCNSIRRSEFKLKKTAPFQPVVIVSIGLIG